MPTSPGPLPPGPKVVYSENLHDGTVLFWVASTVNPDLRRILTTIMDPTDFGINATLSHDQTRIAYTVLPSGVGHNHFAAELWVMNVDGSKRQMLADRIDIGNPLNYPLWSPDDRYLAFRRQTAKEAPFTQTINIIDVQSGEETILVSADETTWLWPLGWSVDGRYVYYKQGATDGVQLRRVDIGNRVSQNVTLIEGAIPACHFFSPDRQWLLCTILQTRRPPSYAVITVPISPEPLRQIVSGASGETGYYQPIWGPGSQEITVNIPPAASVRAELRVIDVKTKHGRSLVSDEQDFFIPRTWSPDAQWLIAQKYSKPGGDLYLIARNGAQIQRIPATGAIRVVGWLTGNLPGETR